MPQKKQLVLFEKWLNPAAAEVLAPRADIEVRILRYADPQEVNWQYMAQAHGYQIAPRGELQQPWFGNAALLARCPNLLAISSTGAGFDMIDVDDCTRAGVLVCHQVGGNREPVAEHALGMMINLAKNTARTHRLLLRGQVPDRLSVLGSELRGKTVGIVGLGNIGTCTAALCKAFGMQVLACDPYVSESQATARGATKVELRDLLQRADFITVHCPLTAETRNLFGRAEFQAMKRGAFFINTARGGTYDEEALAEALRSGHIAGAGLDVFLREPPPADHPLLQFDNVIASPHLAGMTHEATRNMAIFAAEQWLTIFDGRRPPRLENPQAWPLYCERHERIIGVRPRED